MIESLLKNDLPHAYGLHRTNVLLSYRQETGTIELGDQVACSRCKAKFADRSGCNERVMKVDAAKKMITVVEHEDYIKQFNGTQFGKGGTCDFMMFDADSQRKVVFCDLGCYSEEHVEKKQQKSHQQVCNSISRFIKQPCGMAFISQFADKVLIFGRRDPAINQDTIPVPSRGDVIGNMQAFLTNPFSKPKYAVSNEIVEGVGVSFVVVNYPEPYIW